MRGPSHDRWARRTTRWCTPSRHRRASMRRWSLRGRRTGTRGCTSCSASRQQRAMGGSKRCREPSKCSTAGGPEGWSPPATPRAASTPASWGEPTPWRPSATPSSTRSRRPRPRPRRWLRRRSDASPSGLASRKSTSRMHGTARRRSSGCPPSAAMRARRGGAQTRCGTGSAPRSAPARRRTPCSRPAHALVGVQDALGGGQVQPEGQG